MTDINKNVWIKFIKEKTFNISTRRNFGVCRIYNSFNIELRRRPFASRRLRHSSEFENVNKNLWLILT